MPPDLVRLLTGKLPLLGSPRPRPATLEDIGWPEFERLVIQGFVAGGYQMLDGERPAAVIGGELLLRRHRETYLVHCKAWRQARVETATVEALQRSIQARGAQGGFVLSFGRFSREASRYAAAQRIQLLDGPALKALLEPVRARPAPPPPEAGPVTTAARAVPTSPACPLCSSAMRLRTARRGAHAGRGFWSCIKHPDCKGLLPLA